MVGSRHMCDESSWDSLMGTMKKIKEHLSYCSFFFFLQSSPSPVHCFSFHLNDYDRCNGILKYYFIVKTILIVHVIILMRLPEHLCTKL